MITIYKTPGCYICGKVIDQLTEAHVPHEVIDLSTDAAAHEYVTNTLHARAVPVVIDSNNPDAWWSGPDPIAVAALIATYGSAASA